MSIIKSIEQSFSGVTFPINGTNYIARLNGAEMTGILYIHTKNEEWRETTDVRIMISRLNDIRRLSDIINTVPYLLVEYMDFHGYFDLDNILYDANQEYVYIQKEDVREIRGGTYAIDDRIEDNK